MTSSTTLWQIEPSELEHLTRSRFESWLEAAVTNDEVHAQLANTLSLLEHIGSVKIARTQSGPDIDEDVLQHLAEEARHAYVLKRIVRRLSPAGLEGYGDHELLAAAAARGYFARLDVAVRAFARDHVAAHLLRASMYNLVTWLIERRAMWLYPAYQTLLERSRSPLSVRSIIGEETRHLEDVIAALERIGLGSAEDVVDIVRTEEKLFARLCAAIAGKGNIRTP